MRGEADDVVGDVARDGCAAQDLQMVEFNGGYGQRVYGVDGVEHHVGGFARQSVDEMESDGYACGIDAGDRIDGLRPCVAPVDAR